MQHATSDVSALHHSQSQPACVKARGVPRRHPQKQPGPLTAGPHNTRRVHSRQQACVQAWGVLRQLHSHDRLHERADAVTGLGAGDVHGVRTLFQGVDDAGEGLPMNGGEGEGGGRRRGRAAVGREGGKIADALTAPRFNGMDPHSQLLRSMWQIQLSVIRTCCGSARTLDPGIRSRSMHQI